MTTLEYSAAPFARSRRLVGWFFRAAILCGILPMTAGFLFLFCFWLTRRDWFIGAGLWTLPIGSAVVLLGLAAWIVSLVMKLRLARADGIKLRWSPLLITLFLLLANVPAGAFRAWEGFRLVFTTYADVLNETGAPLECDLDFGGPATKTTATIPPGGTLRKTSRSGFFGDVVNLTVRQNGSTAEFHEPDYGWVRFHIQPGLTSSTERIR